jgi:structural maintenance of chromosome 4
MPPRRSSRPTRASVEPSAVNAPTSKRKRASAAELNRVAHAKENITKSTSKNGTKSAAIGLNDELEEAQEADEDGSDAPPSKKPKSSPDDEESDGVAEATEDEEEEEEKRKSRRLTVRKASSSQPMRRERVEDVLSDDEVPSKPVQGTRKATVKAPGTRRTSKVPSRSQTSRSTIASNEVEEGASHPAPKGRRSSAQPATRRASGRRAAAPQSTTEKVEEEELVPPKGRRLSVQPSSKRSTTRRSPEPEPEPIPELDEEELPVDPPPAPQVATPDTRALSDDEAEEVAAHLSLDAIEASDDEIEPIPASPRKQKTRVVAAPPPEYEEEEMSLLEPEIPKLTISQPRIQAVPEEPKGPISRLVIHKLVLINFKSYAGRQEIGPFHKVCAIVDLFNLLALNSSVYRSRSPPSLDLTGLASLTLLTLYSLFLATAHRKCGKANSPS